MDPAILLYAVILLAVPTLIGGLALVLFGDAIRSHRRAARRLAAIERGRAGAVAPEALEALRKEVGARIVGGRRGVSVQAALQARLVRAGVALSPGQAMALMAGIAAAAFAGLTLWTEAALVLRAVLAPVVGIGAVMAWVGKRAKARLAAIEEALPDAVELMVRSLRVGHPFSSAVQIVAREVPGPLGVEMSALAEETAYGRDTGEALSEMAERVGLQDLRFLAVAVTIQAQAGGNLAEVLDGLARVIRARFRLFRRVRAITAEAKWSGMFLSAFPVVATVGLNLLKPDYFDTVRGTAFFMPAAGAVLAFLVVNVLVMRRLVDIKV